jgi:hypothetical protein
MLYLNPALIATLGVLAVALVRQPALGGESGTSVHWHSEYRPAMQAAAESRKLLLIWFFDPADGDGSANFEARVLGSSAVAERLARRFVVARLPLDAIIDREGDKPLALIGHPAFAELGQGPGLVIIDLTEPEGPHYRQLVSIIPFTAGPISSEKLLVLLDLPRGTLTQRTMIYAVRTHRDSPASAASHLSPLLLHETASHAEHQARLNLQGHHQWETRFHAINAALGGGLVAREVCAESWPGQGLLEAAEECVDSWRQSPGHWAAVSRRHALFGYDMQRGTSGVWFAAGIFAD